MRFVQKSVLAIAAGSALLGLLPAAHAASQDFAQTILSDSSGADDFAFTNNITSASFDTITGGAAATFFYDTAAIDGTLPLALQGNLPAHIFLTSSTASPAGSFAGFDFQSIDSGSFQVLLDTPYNGLSNLLTVDFTNAALDGFDGPGSPAQLDTQDGLDSETASYSSDFLTFTGSTFNNNFSFNPDTTNPGLAIDGNFLANFTTNGLSTATYDNTYATVTADSVPEPTAVMLLSAGSLLLLRRKSRVAR